MKTQSRIKYYCRFCGSIIDMPKNEYKAPGELKVGFCPVCLAKGKKRQMLEVLEQ